MVNDAHKMCFTSIQNSKVLCYSVARAEKSADLMQSETRKQRHTDYVFHPMLTSPVA